MQEIDRSGAAKKPPAVWTERGSPAYRRISLALFLVGFATFSLVYCVQPLLPNFAESFGVSVAQSSLALSVTTGTLAFSIMAASVVSEGLGRRAVMFGATSSAAILNIVAAFAPNWTLLLVARALEGLVLGGVPAIAMAYLAEEIAPRGLGFAMGLYVGGTAFGGMFGRVLVGILTEWTSWRVALATIGGLGLFAAIGFVVLLPTSRNFTPREGFDPGWHLEAWAGHLRDRGLLLLFGIGGLAMGAFVTVYNYAGFRLIAPPYNLSQTQISLIFTAYLFGIIASSVAGALADRLGRGPVLVAGLLIALAGVALTALAPLGAVIGGIIVLTFGFFAAHAVASGWVGRLAKGAKGHASSLYLLTYYVGSSVMGSLGGWFWSLGGWPCIVAFTGLLFSLALAAALILQRLPRQPS
jgi:YNFM family putative membrane transporter